MNNNINNDIEKSIKNNIATLEVLKNKKVLITGGTGFVGTWLTYTIVWLNDNYKFNCQIILLSRYQNDFKKTNDCLALRDDVEFISSDIRSVNNLPNDINFIIHAASSPDNRMHMSDPINTLDIISNGTKTILDEATRLSQLEGILHLSSGQVYGAKLVNAERLREDMNNSLGNNIKSIYSNAKHYSEVICLAYQSQCKLPITIVRPFSFIGPFQELNKPWAINTFFEEAMNNQPMRIVGNGKPQRSYLYASDMAVWLLVLLVKGKRGKTYNLGSENGISLSEVTKKINEYLSVKVDVIIQNYNDDESKFIPDLKLIKSELGLKEEFTIDEAIAKTIQWNLEK